jgi:two-component system, chemotaxis family, chemotaxis protein CheY
MSYDILIVDDSAVTRALIKRTIKLTDLPIGALYEADDGQSGLDLLADRRVDLVLADLHMPNMSGVEMTKRILANEKTCTTPVVIISAEPDRDQIDMLKHRGIKGYLRKPFTPEHLCHLLTDVLGVAHD